MMKLLSTVAVAALALAGPAFAQESTTAKMALSGPGTVCAPATAASTTGTSTETTASTTSTTTTGTTATGGAASSTMALSADNQINPTIARTALTNSQTNVERLASLGTPQVVCLVDLDTLAQSDATLKEDISKFQTNNATIKSALETNTALTGQIKTLHPTFDVSKVRAMDVGPNGELVLYVISGT